MMLREWVSCLKSSYKAIKLFVLGFAIAGLSIIYKNRMLKEINE